MGFQILRQGERRGSRIKHDGVAVLYVFVSGGGDGALFASVLLGALEKGSIEATAMREYRAAERALQEILAFEVVQILSNRNHTDRKSVSQLANIQGPSFLQEVKYLLPTLFRFHAMEN
jgi:hypothetical protein